MEIEEKREFSREYKLAALSRMAAGVNVKALAAELGIPREYLYKWLKRFRAGGPDALRGPGRQTRAERGAMRTGAVLEPQAWAPIPSAVASDELERARERISELERKIGRQELELDFFQRALRQVEEVRRTKGVAGETASTRSSK